MKLWSSMKKFHEMLHEKLHEAMYFEEINNNINTNVRKVVELKRNVWISNWTFNKKWNVNKKSCIKLVKKTKSINV